MTTEIQSRRDRRLPCDTRHAGPVEYAVNIRHQSAQVRTEAGCENDRANSLGRSVQENDAVRREPVDPAAYLDRAIPDPGEGADIDQRHAPIVLAHLARTFGRAAQSELLEITERQPQDRPVDDIDQTCGQMLIEDGPRHDGKTKQIPRDDLHWTANGHHHVDAGIRKVKGDLATGIAEADHEHTLSGERKRIAIVDAVNDSTRVGL